MEYMYMYIYWNMYIYMCFFGGKRLIPSRTHCYTAESFHSRSLAEFISQSGFNILIHKATSNFLAVWFQFNAIWQLHESLTLASECLVIATLWFFRMWNRTRVPWQWVAFQAKQMWAKPEVCIGMVVGNITSWHAKGALSEERLQARSCIMLYPSQS